MSESQPKRTALADNDESTPAKHQIQPASCVCLIRDTTVTPVVGRQQRKYQYIDKPDSFKFNTSPRQVLSLPCASVYAVVDKQHECARLYRDEIRLICNHISSVKISRLNLGSLLQRSGINRSSSNHLVVGWTNPQVSELLNCYRMCVRTCYLYPLQLYRCQFYVQPIL